MASQRISLYVYRFIASTRTATQARVRTLVKLASHCGHELYEADLPPLQIQARRGETDAEHVQSGDGVRLGRPLMPLEIGLAHEHLAAAVHLARPRAGLCRHRRRGLLLCRRGPRRARAGGVLLLVGLRGAISHWDGGAGG